MIQQPPQMPPLEEAPTAPGVLDALHELLEDLDVAGGEIVITCQPGTLDRWTVQLLTDVGEPGQPCRHRGSSTAFRLPTALDDAVAELLEDQALA